ncbi:MAG: hypothetical protein AB7O97_07025 [Planctomycetota bacterium]
MIPRILPSLAVAFVLACAATAQAPGPAALRQARPSPPAWAEVSAGFACVDARGPEVLAVGRRWRAAFGERDVEFRPALGRKAERAWPLRVQLRSVQREGAAIEVGALACERRVREADRIVEFVRPGLVERYEARPEGLEQTFTLAAPPPGGGDLVITLEVATDLPLGAAATEELQWRVPGLGGVSMGAVVGIDALGRRAAGELRRDGDRVDLRLPGWFVDAAAWPLVVDPLIGPVVDALAGYDIDFPDVAYEPFSDSYCAVWTMYQGGGTSDVVGAVYRASDRQLAYAFVINQPGDEDSIRVTAIRGMGVYVMAWCNLSDPAGIKLSTMTLEPTQGIGSQVYVLAGPGAIDAPQLSGEATLFDDDCLIVWDDAQYGAVGASLIVNPDLTMGMTQPLVIGGGPDAYEISISKQGGQQGLHLVTWVDRPAGLPGWVRAQVVDHDMNLMGPGAWVQQEPQNAGRPASDGDGFQFLVAFEQQEVQNPSSTDVLGRLLTVSTAGITTIGQALELAAYPSFTDGYPDVALLGDRFAAAYQSGIPGQPYIDDCYVRVFERNGTPVGDEQHLDLTIAGNYQFEHAPRLISRRDGDADTTADDGLVVFADQDNRSAESDIGLQAIEAMGQGGPVVDLGGGCGPAGLCAVRGACALGNQSFAIDLHAAQTLAVPFLIVGWSPRPVLTCGVCAITDPHLFLFGANTAGTATTTLALPTDAAFAGLPLELQWIAFNVAYVGCPLVPGAAASNRVQATIGY